MGIAYLGTLGWIIMLPKVLRPEHIPIMKEFFSIMIALLLFSTKI